jgi:Arc/MetJ family transcription regulator
MRTLIDIQAELIRDLLKETNAKTKKEAIIMAIETYLNLKRRERLASLIGNYDYGSTIEELERMRGDD